MNGHDAGGPTLEVTDSREQTRRELASRQLAAWTVAMPTSSRDERVALAVDDADALLAALDQPGAAT